MLSYTVKLCLIGCFRFVAGCGSAVTVEWRQRGVNSMHSWHWLSGFVSIGFWTGIHIVGVQGVLAGFMLCVALLYLCTVLTMASARILCGCIVAKVVLLLCLPLL
jgi:hypothetical protein